MSVCILLFVKLILLSRLNACKNPLTISHIYYTETFDGLWLTKDDTQWMMAASGRYFKDDLILSLVMLCH